MTSSRLGSSSSSPRADASSFPRENPRIGRARPDIHEEARVYRLAKRGRDAAHVFVYVITSDDSIVLVRLLDEAMDLPRQFPRDYADSEVPFGAG